jgi:SAM-dependent methyltransferase
VSERDLRGVADLYTRSLAEHGTEPRGVGWRDDETHLLRFAKLVEVIAPDDRAPDLNDLGCGYGALWRYLDSIGRRPSRYVGYDISEEMLAEARGVLPDDVELIRGSRLETHADYGFGSGIFNVRLETPESEWAKHVRASLRDLYDHSRRGFAFNALTSYVDYREPNLYYADPREWLDFCKRELSPRVALLHDYPLYEWTMIVRRP